MQPEDREPLYWALSEIAEGEPSDDALVPDSTLVAYRAGELDDAEAREVERLLVRNPANRRRLEAIAGATPTDAPSEARRRILEATVPSPSLPPSRHWQRWVAVAAVVTLVVAFGWLTQQPGQGELPAYEVTISALAKRRDSVTPTLTAEAYVDSIVKIDATVDERAIDGVDIGLYRRIENRLEKLPVGDGLKITERQGAVRFTAPAAKLVGREPGDYDILVAIAWHDQLPTAITLEPGDDPAATLAAGDDRQVHRLTLRLLAENSAKPINGKPIDGRRASDEESAYVFSEYRVSEYRDSEYRVSVLVDPVHHRVLDSKRPCLQVELDPLRG